MTDLIEDHGLPLVSVGEAPTTEPETLTEGMRRRLNDLNTCPTCHQPVLDGGMRALAERIGIGHSVLWRFLKGGDMTGRNLDLVASFLDGVTR